MISWVWLFCWGLSLSEFFCLFPASQQCLTEADGGKKICLKDESPILFNQNVFAEHFTKFQSGEKALDEVTLCKDCTL